MNLRSARPSNDGDRLKQTGISSENTVRKTSDQSKSNSSVETNLKKSVEYSPTREVNFFYIVQALSGIITLLYDMNVT